MISSDISHRENIARVARRCGLYLVFSPCLADACDILARQRFALIFCTDRLPDSDLPASLQSLRDAATGVPVIVLSRLAEWPACIDAMCAGAFDYIACPAEPAETERILRLALGQHRVMRARSAA
jgi:DNA-binding NtrC family response regulator